MSGLCGDAVGGHGAARAEVFEMFEREAQSGDGRRGGGGNPVGHGGAQKLRRGFGAQVDDDVRLM